MAEEEKLKLGKGAAFVKSRLKRLPQVDEVWEADFEALPKPIMQTETHYLGMVVTKKGGTLLADLTVHGRPTVNDLATLLAHAMQSTADRKCSSPQANSFEGASSMAGIVPGPGGTWYRDLGRAEAPWYREGLSG